MSRGSLVRLGGLALLWGSGFLLIRVALAGLSPAQIVLGRMVLGAALLVVVVWLRGLALPRSTVVWAHLTSSALVANLIPYYLYGWGEQHVSSALAGVLNATTPLVTLGLALVTRTEPRRPGRETGILLGFLGVLVIMAPWRAGAAGSRAGILVCVLAAASYGVAYIYQRRFLVGRGHPPLVLAAGQLTAGALLLTAASPLVARGTLLLTPAVVVSVVILGILGTGVAYVLNYRLIEDEGPTSASLVTYLIPVVAVILGVVVLREPVTWNLVVGAVIILAGVAVSEGRLRRRAEARR